jgi:1-acyl-sn-glycerol-3-phosphate acyltransferase
MKPPEVKLDNPEVFDYFTTHKINENYMKILHGVSALLFNSKRVFMDDTLSKIDEHFKDDKPAIFSMNHVTWFDPLYYASVIRREREFRPAIGNIVIPGNAPYFNKPLIGKIIAEGGCIPVFRSKDSSVFGDITNLSEEEIEIRRKKANDISMGICVDHLNSGTNVAIFAEGTRNRGDRKQIQKMHDGLGRILEGTEKPENLIVVCMSGYFGEKKIKNLIDPSIAIGSLAVEGSISETLGEIREKQQKALDVAIADYQRRTTIID